MTDAERTLIHEALRFAVWAAGKGICPADGENASAPEDFLFDYSIETDETDWMALPDRILAALEPAATCKESLQVEPAAPEGQQPVADALKLFGDTGELIDRMAEAIRGDTTPDETPWSLLPEDRKIGWRGDAERALAVVKEYLTARLTASALGEQSE